MISTMAEIVIAKLSEGCNIAAAHPSINSNSAG